MEQDKIKKVYEILNNIPVTLENADIIEEIKQELLNIIFYTKIAILKTNLY